MCPTKHSIGKRWTHVCDIVGTICINCFFFAVRHNNTHLTNREVVTCVRTACSKNQTRQTKIPSFFHLPTPLCRLDATLCVQQDEDVTGLLFQTVLDAPYIRTRALVFVEVSLLLLPLSLLDMHLNWTCLLYPEAASFLRLLMYLFWLVIFLNLLLQPN